MVYERVTYTLKNDERQRINRHERARISTVSFKAQPGEHSREFDVVGRWFDSTGYSHRWQGIVKKRNKKEHPSKVKALKLGYRSLLDTFSVLQFWTIRSLINCSGLAQLWRTSDGGLGIQAEHSIVAVYFPRPGLLGALRKSWQRFVPTESMDSLPVGRTHQISSWGKCQCWVHLIWSSIDYIGRKNYSQYWGRTFEKFKRNRHSPFWHLYGQFITHPVSTEWPYLWSTAWHCPMEKIAVGDMRIRHLSYS